MYKIYIDTTERFQKKVTLKKDGVEVDFLEGDIDIVTAIKKILVKNNLKPENIDEFIPNPGPGSFTGIKIGVTVANVLNWVLGKKEMDELVEPQYGKLPNIQ
jgi:hypothetical protein